MVGVRVWVRVKGRVRVRARVTVRFHGRFGVYQCADDKREDVENLRVREPV